MKLSVWQRLFLTEQHTVIPQTVLVDNTALALMRYISHPDTPDAKSIGLRTGVDFLPERVIEFLYRFAEVSPDSI